MKQPENQPQTRILTNPERVQDETKELIQQSEGGRVSWKKIVLDAIERVVNRYQRTEFTIEELFKECIYVSTCPHLETTLKALQRKGVIEDFGSGEFAYTLYDGDLW